MCTNFHEFCESTGFHENINMKICTHSTSLQLQAVIRKIKITRIVRCGAFAKYMSCENLYAYGSLNIVEFT